MKTFFKARALFSSLIITYSSRAKQRETLSQLFNAVENKIRYRNTELEKIFIKTRGSKYQISLQGNFNFTGIVVSSMQRYEDLKSLLTKSTGLIRACLQF